MYVLSFVVIKVFNAVHKMRKWNLALMLKGHKWNLALILSGEVLTEPTLSWLVVDNCIFATKIKYQEPWTNADLFYLTTSSIHLSGVLVCVDSYKRSNIYWCNWHLFSVSFPPMPFLFLFIVGADYFLNFPSNRIDLHSHKISQYF
jgi:hypothetical protein